LLIRVAKRRGNKVLGNQAGLKRFWLADLLLSFATSL
jgi:hypothetical protein